MKNPSFCHKHSYINTNIICARCGDPICPDCALRDINPPYCSSLCFNLDTLRNKFKARKGAVSVNFNENPAFKKTVIFISLAAYFLSILALLYPSSATYKTVAPDNISVSSKKRDFPEYAPPAHKTSKYYPSISRVADAGKRLSLTFDGGSSDSSAMAILKILDKRQIKTTFFITGRFIKKYPHIIKKILSDGHEIGNHTMSHPHLTTYDKNRKFTTAPGIDYEFMKKELIHTNSLFRDLTGKEMAPLWRAPFGEKNREILKWASQLGYQHIGWTIDRKARTSMDSLDWVSDKSSPIYLTADEIKERLLSFDESGLANGGIALMHLGTNRKNDIAHEKLGEIIDAFISMGYEVVPISRLLERKS